MSSPVLGSATARIVGRRRCSKRLAFYDLRELADVEPDAQAVLDAHFGTEGTAAVAPRSVELVAKADSAGFADEAELAVAQKECLKLGNVVRVYGAWRVCESDQGKCVELACRSVSVVRRWADANPGVHFQKPKETRAGLRAAAADADAGAEANAAGTSSDGNAASFDGANPRAPCKFWVNQGACHKGDACRYAHGGDRAAAAKKWIEDRKRRRRLLAVAEGDPHGPEDPLASKAHRAAKFADWLVRTFGVETLSRGSGVLDVAGGRGDVSWELHTVRGVPCTLVEPRARKLNRLQHKWLRREVGGGGRRDVCDAMPATPTERNERNVDDEDKRDDENASTVLCPQVRAEFRAETWDAFAECSVVVGMHPDQATEGIMEFAKAHGKPFAIVPCCVFPALFPDRRVPANESADESAADESAADESTADGAKTPETEPLSFGKDGGVPVTRLAQLVRYLARETGGRVARLEFQGANSVVYSTEPPRRA